MKIIASLLFSFLSLPMMAQSAKTMFYAIPDTLLPYVDKKVCAVTEHSDAHITAAVAKEVKYDLLRLPAAPAKSCDDTQPVMEVSDSVYCLLITANTPEPSTVSYIYNKEWQLLSRQSFERYQFLDTAATDSLTAAPSLESLMEFYVVEAQWSGDALTLIAHPLYLSAEDSKRLLPKVKALTLHWNGKCFQYKFTTHSLWRTPLLG